jgi:hypothetical protein
MENTDQRLPQLRIDPFGFPQLRVEPFGRSISLSFLMHFAAVLIILRFPHFGPTVTLNVPSASPRTKNTILYVVPVAKDRMIFAKISAAESGGAAGKGTAPGKPALGSSAFHRKLTAVSAPLHPSNSHQLILQPSSPPDVLIKQEIKLPNSILGNPLVMPREQVDIVLSGPKRMPTHRNDSADVASPPLPVPASKLNLAAVPAMAKPQLPVAAAPEPQTDPDSKSAPSAASAGVGEKEGVQKSLLVLSTDPGKAKMALPPGNKYGEFSFSPSGTSFGSPGGRGDLAIGGGSDGISAAGDGSMGVGHGKEGGGGKDSAGSPEVSLNGAGAAGGGYQMMIFPVPPAAPVRKNAMIISAGPIGGGGLGVYKALPCGRIFTIFLPMPVANWTLEYCTAGKPAAPMPRNATTVQLEEAVVPPSPLQTFDFRRPPISREKAPKNIILKGLIREDGSVANLQIYQGIMREADETAKATFNLWKFAPAMRAGKPVAVEILVGIPSLATATN